MTDDALFSYTVRRSSPEQLPGGSWLVTGGPAGIGWASDEVVAIDAGAAADSALAVVHRERLVATARPADTAPPQLEPGVLALRWFELAAADWPEFLDLSVQAWPVFERAYRARILGLFRSLDAAEPAARALLVTWYASLAEWERSRATVRATSGEQADAGRRFRRRHELTRRGIVRVAPHPLR